jgi:hypothetical protein
MPTAMNASRTALLKNSLRKSLYLAAAAGCLWPAAVNAQSWNPTASDAQGNTAAGDFALAGHTGGGADNVGIGFAALTTNTTGIENTAIGTSALYFNTTGSFNTASGRQALHLNTTGGYNTASGSDALYNNTTGGNNTASGYQALTSNKVGSNNVAFGYNALTRLAAGGSNIALGTSAGKNLTAGSHNIYVGHYGAAGGSESNVIYIGQTQTKTFIAGISGVPLSGATVVVKANGQLGVIASSARYKMEIRELTGASDRLTQLHPVSYQYKAEPGVTHYGLIAEEVEKVMPELVVHDEQDRPETVQYHELIPLLVQQVNRQRDLIERQTALLERLEARLDRQAAELAGLRGGHFAASGSLP